MSKIAKYASAAGSSVNETGANDIPELSSAVAVGSGSSTPVTNNLTKNNTYTFRVNLKDGSYIQFSAGTK
jgi:hypothetical protein